MQRKIYRAIDEKSTRTAIERNDVAVITHLEEAPKKDKLRHAESGLTPVIARIAAKHNTALGINLASIKTYTLHEKARILARMRQNIRIARNAHMPLAHKGNAEDIRYVLLSLGASTKQAAQARTQSF